MSHKITRQQAIERAPLLKAWGEGGKLQYRYNNDPWADCSDYGDILSDGAPNVQYRIKSTPTLRPWRPEEVPVGALIRNKATGDYYYQALILSADTHHIYTVANLATVVISTTLGDALQYREHSLDHGKTWLPCGVVE